MEYLVTLKATRNRGVFDSTSDLGVKLSLTSTALLLFSAAYSSKDWHASIDPKSVLEPSCGLITLLWSTCIQGFRLTRRMFMALVSPIPAKEMLDVSSRRILPGHCERTTCLSSVREGCVYTHWYGYGMPKVLPPVRGRNGIWSPSL
jgi:hypothetical protein